ncbi:MAG: multicopper oxidase domain-containing protein [Candidatus Limnocylindrales bacterium]
MTDRRRLLLSRRQLLKYGGLTAIAAGAAGVGPSLVGRILQPGRALGADQPPSLKLVGTDGWISLPPSPSIFSSSLGVTTHPDPYAPDGRTTYIFGFANASGLADDVQFNLKNKAQHSAPLFWTTEGADFRVQLTNVGLAQRPDLFDEHTVHWHGFKNVIPFFDGEPTGSVSIPQGQTFTYVYISRDPGTYMFHCHVEDTEHVQMGMTGLVFVRPAQDGNTSLYPSGKYAYNDGDGSTGFDREYAMFLSEVWGDSHWADAHIQLPEWSDYRADFSLLNGRVYPDTLLPNGSIARHGDHPTPDFSVMPARDPGTWDLQAPAGRPDLANQPNSALISCNAGERVLLRFANLGFMEAAMTLAGIKMRVVGRDATPMRGRTGFSTVYETNTLSFGAGESFDVILEAPAYVGPGPYDTYVLYNRAYTRGDNLVGDGGGQRTEVHVYPTGTLPSQAYPNQHPGDPA